MSFLIVKVTANCGLSVLRSLFGLIFNEFLFSKKQMQLFSQESLKHS